MGDVLPFNKRHSPVEGGSAGDEVTTDRYDRAGAALHRVFDQLAGLEGFAVGLPKDRLLVAAHHAVDLQDEVHLLTDFKDDPTSEDAQRLADMADQLEIVPFAEYISSLTALDAHRTPQRVMVYTSTYIDKIPLL